MVLSVYRLTLLKGFLRKFSRVGECTICYETARLYSLHQEGNLHGICRTCIGSYNKTVCHMCRSPIPAEILNHWNIQNQEENDILLEEIDAYLTAIRARYDEFFQTCFIEPMNNILANENAYTLSNLQILLANARRIVEEGSYSTQNLTMAYEVIKLIEAGQSQEYFLTYEFFCSLLNRIRNYGPLDSAHTMVIPTRMPGVDVRIIDHQDFYAELDDVALSIFQIKHILSRLLETPDISYENFVDKTKLIDFWASKLVGKVPVQTQFLSGTGGNVVTLSELLDKKYNY
jgi:hypothetical protein